MMWRHRWSTDEWNLMRIDGKSGRMNVCTYVYVCGRELTITCTFRKMDSLEGVCYKQSTETRVDISVFISFSGQKVILSLHSLMTKTSSVLMRIISGPDRAVRPVLAVVSLFNRLGCDVSIRLELSTVWPQPSWRRSSLVFRIKWQNSREPKDHMMADTSKFG